MTRVFDDDLHAGFATRAVHAGQRPEPLAGAIMTPVYLTSTYVQEGLGQNKGYEYARGRNPTREALERNVAALWESVGALPHPPLSCPHDFSLHEYRHDARI
jgi:cystathionine beta-lyase/cystathionine gamma-synthase